MGNDASQVQFFVDDAVVLEVDGANAEYSVFKGFANGIAAGRTTGCGARHLRQPRPSMLDSVPALITVDAARPTAQTVELTADVTLLGGMPYGWSARRRRVRLNSNGHRITGTGSGAVTLKIVDASTSDRHERTRAGYRRHHHRQR